MVKKIPCRVIGSVDYRKNEKVSPRKEVSQQSGITRSVCAERARSVVEGCSLKKVGGYYVPENSGEAFPAGTFLDYLA